MLFGICLALILSLNAAAPPATYVTVVQPGKECPVESQLAAPYSVVYINSDVGEIVQIEHISCDGERTVSDPLTGASTAYQAYNTTLYTDNIPKLSAGFAGTIFVSLESAARIDVRDGASGELIESFPGDEPLGKEYIISAKSLTSNDGHLIVVDVIRPSDGTYRGTASIPYSKD